MEILFIIPLYHPFDEMVLKDDVQKWDVKIGKVQKVKSVPIAYPNGLLSISAYVTKCFPNSIIKILDFNLLLYELADDPISNITAISREEFWAYCLAKISSLKPEIIGLSLMFCGMYQDAAPFTEFLRGLYPTSLIVAGGHLCSGDYQTLLRNVPQLNAICYGEGEIPFVELITAIQNNSVQEFLLNDKSWIIKEDINFDKESDAFNQPNGKFIINLDEIPPYNFDLILSYKSYHKYGKAFLFSEKLDARFTYHMFTSRGCPGRCIFCASQNVHGHKIRYHSIQRVKDDLMLYMSRGDIDAVDFYDDHFLADKKRAIEILEFASENGIKTNVGNPAFFSIDEEIVSVFKKVGIKEVILALENANEDTLKNIIHKPGSLKRAKQAIDALRAEGMTIIGNILTGFPGETKEAIDKCLIEMLKLECNWYSCYVVAPLPGSELYKICREKGYIDTNLDIYKMDFKKAVITTEDFDPTYIEKRVYEMNLYVNFVKNYDMRVGNYETALGLFERILTDVIDTHAFAYYYAAVCAEKLGKIKKCLAYRTMYLELIEKSDFWREWSVFFQLQL